MKKKTLRRLLFAGLLCGVLVGSGCSTNWADEAGKIVSRLVPATENLMSLIAAFGGKVSPQDLQTIQDASAQAEADLQLIESLLGVYQRADATSQLDLLNQIQIVISDTESNLNGILPAVHIEDAATKAKVTAVLGLLLSEVQSMAAIVPPVNRGARVAKTSVLTRQMRRRSLLTSGEFASSYNATMTSKTGHANLDRATSGWRIKCHGKFERWASAGLLK